MNTSSPMALNVNAMARVFREPIQRPQVDADFIFNALCGFFCSKSVAIGPLIHQLLSWTAHRKVALLQYRLPDRELETFRKWMVVVLNWKK